MSEVNVAARPALAVCTNSNLAFFKPRSLVFSIAQENKVLRDFWNHRTRNFHSFNTTFKECITQLTSNQKVVAPLLLGPDSTSLPSPGWRGWSAECGLGIHRCSWAPPTLSNSLSYQISFPVLSLNISSCLDSPFLKIVYLRTTYFIWTSTQVSLLSGKALFKSIYLKRPTQPSVLNSLRSTLCLYHFTEIALIKVMTDASQGPSPGVSVASHPAEPIPFLLAILSWDSYIIQLWTFSRFYPSTFSMLSLENLTCMAEIKLILYHTCQIHTETLDF